MDAVSIAGSVLAMKTEQTQQLFSASMMKQAIDQQNKLAGLLAQSVQQTPQTSVQGSEGFDFSTYA